MQTIRSGPIPAWSSRSATAGQDADGSPALRPDTAECVTDDVGLARLRVEPLPAVERQRYGHVQRNLAVVIAPHATKGASINGE